MIVPSHHTALGTNSLEHKERYVIVTDEEWYILVKVAVNTIVPRSCFFFFLYLKTQTVTHIRKNAVEYLRQ